MARTGRLLLTAGLSLYLLAGCGGGGGGSGSDAVGTAALAVAPAADEGVTLRWNAPRARLNGDAVARHEITHYRVQISNLAGTVEDQFNVNFGDAGTATVTNLPPGIYEFRVFAVDINGVSGLAASATFLVAAQ